jgi:hypothetical protein
VCLDPIPANTPHRPVYCNTANLNTKDPFASSNSTYIMNTYNVHNSSQSRHLANVQSTSLALYILQKKQEQKRCTDWKQTYRLLYNVPAAGAARSQSSNLYAYLSIAVLVSATSLMTLIAGIILYWNQTFRRCQSRGWGLNGQNSIFAQRRSQVLDSDSLRYAVLTKEQATSLLTFLVRFLVFGAYLMRTHPQQF